MADTRPRNSEGQFSPETGGGTNPASFQAAYNPAVIMQNNQSRQAIISAVNKRKMAMQPQHGVEATVPNDSPGSATMMSRKEFAEMKCWPGYKKKGMKKSGHTGKMVNNCVKDTPASSKSLSLIGRLTELAAMSEAIETQGLTPGNDPEKETRMVATKLATIAGEASKALAQLESGKPVDAWMVAASAVACEHVVKIANHLEYGIDPNSAHLG